MTELTEQQSLTLSRLRRCDRWVETGRNPELRWVTLTGVRAGRTEVVRFDLELLSDLLKMGLVECDASPRLQGVPYWNAISYEQVTQRYWRALPGDADAADAR